MYAMFYLTDSFNIDLSGWIVSSVTNMGGMFNQATAYTQVLCGKTWIESTNQCTCSKDEVNCQISSATGIVPSTAANCRSCGDYINVLGLNWTILVQL